MIRNEKSGSCSIVRSVPNATAICICVIGNLHRPVVEHEERLAVGDEVPDFRDELDQTVGTPRLADERGHVDGQDVFGPPVMKHRPLRGPGAIDAVS